MPTCRASPPSAAVAAQAGLAFADGVAPGSRPSPSPLPGASPWWGVYLDLSAGGALTEVAYGNENINQSTLSPVAHHTGAPALGQHAGLLLPWGPLALGADLAYVHTDIQSRDAYVKDDLTFGGDDGVEFIGTDELRRTAAQAAKTGAVVRDLAIDMDGATLTLSLLLAPARAT